MRQVEISRTIVFDAPRHARGFFEALVADNLDIGRPHNVEIIFARKIRRDTRASSGPRSTAATTAASWSMSSISTRGSSSTSKTAGRCGSRRSSTPPATWAATPAYPTWTSSRPRPAPPTGAYWKPSVPARAPSLRAQPLSGSRTLPQRGGAEDPGPAVRRSSGHGPGRRPMPDAARRNRLHQQEPARLDRRAARQRLHPRADDLRPAAATPERADPALPHTVRHPVQDLRRAQSDDQVPWRQAHLMVRVRRDLASGFFSARMATPA